MLERQRETWSQMALGTDAVGIPIAWAFDGPNRHDIPLLEPTLVSLPDHNLDLYVGRLHLDKGYDARTVRALLGPLVQIDGATQPRVFLANRKECSMSKRCR